jgi:hypothetical protein
MLISATPTPAQVATARPTQETPAKQKDSRPRYKGYVEPAYQEASVNSVYVQMRDGIRIAVDVVLPKGLPTGAKVPALLTFTRYWRARDGGKPDSLQMFFASHGYATLAVDVRGTGASSGTWTMPWSAEEVRDYGEVVDWVLAQPWSDGKVGVYGNSYGGNAALLLASLNHPAVKAVLPRHYEFDEFTDVPFPGGVMNDWLIKTWDEANHQLDQGAGVKPVDADADRSLLRGAIREHSKNIELYKAARQLTFRDDRIDAGGRGVTLDDLSVQHRRGEIGRSKAAVGAWGGWFDAATADAVIKSFLSLGSVQRAFIGAWNHGASQNASPYFSAASQKLALMYEWLRFFDQHLKGVDTGVAPGRVLFYYTVGEERWKATPVWPVVGMKQVRWYMASGNTLSTSAPETDTGADTYKVDFEASTGEKNRWRTQLGGPVSYLNRAEEDRRLLIYTSEPLAEDTEVTGYPVITLQVTSTHTDGAFFVYLEEVDEAGKVTYLTEGQLRAIHRKVSKDATPYATGAPHRTFMRKDEMPLVQGETAELKFGLLPISALIRKGHRIRVAIAGHDKSVFARTPAEGNPVISVARNRRFSSFIELPIVGGSSRPITPPELLTYFEPVAGQETTKVDPKIYDAYVGQYQLGPDVVISITSVADKLFGEMPGQPKVELSPQSESRFSVKGTNLHVTFVRNKEGQMTGLVLHQNGRDLEAKKIK